MSNGVPILDTVTRKCKVEQISKFVFKIILTQGLNRQIRRMCEYLDYEVTALKRTRIINISLDVHVGRYRELTDDEIKQLNKLIESLPAGYKTVFNLYAIEGYTHQEIAEMLGIQEGTSKSQLSRARGLLQQKLNELQV